MVQNSVEKLMKKGSNTVFSIKVCIYMGRSVKQKVLEGKRLRLYKEKVELGHLCMLRGTKLYDRFQKIQE